MKMTHIPFRWAYFLAAILVTLAMPSPAPAQDNTAPVSTIPVISMQASPLPTAIDILARQSQLNYILDPHLSDSSQSVSFTWTNVSPRDGLNRLLKEHNLELIENPATTVARIAPQSLHVKPVDPALVGHDTNAAVIPVIMMNYAPLDVAIQNLAAPAKLNVEVDEDSLPTRGQPAPMVSFRWQNLAARQALVALLDNYDLTLVESPGNAVIHITSKPKN